MGDNPGTSLEQPRDWVGINEAARRLGVTPKAVRNRIAAGTIEWRPAGNMGREVLVPAPDRPGDDPGTKDLLERIEALRVDLSQEVERRARAEGELAGVRQALERGDRERDALREELAWVRAELAEVRRPLLLRLVEALRRRG